MDATLQTPLEELTVIEADIQAQLQATDEDIAKLDGGFGSNYRALVDGSDAIARSTAMHEVLRIKRSALTAGLAGVRRDIEAAVERARVAEALAVREQLETAVRIRVAAAEQLATAVESLATAMLVMRAAGFETASITGRVEAAVLTSGGWVVAPQGGAHDDEYIQHLVQLRLHTRLGDTWAYSRVPSQGWDVPIVAEIESAGRQLITQFNTKARLPGALVVPEPVDHGAAWEEKERVYAQQVAQARAGTAVLEGDDDAGA